MKGLCGAGLAVVREGRALLRDVDFSLRRGERIAIVGPSGCGKTSLLRAVCGLDVPAGGTVTLDGSAPDALGWPAFRRRVVLVAQRPRLGPGTVADALRRPFGYGTAARAFDTAIARERLAAVGVADTWDQPAERLSEGQAQRVGLVRALLVEPPFLLLDEPTSALDAAAAAAVEESVALSGAGALVVTHDEAQAARWCDCTIDLGEHVVA